MRKFYLINENMHLFMYENTLSRPKAINSLERYDDLLNNKFESI
jgi:hypothetical protein